MAGATLFNIRSDNIPLNFAAGIFPQISSVYCLEKGKKNQIAWGHFLCHIFRLYQIKLCFAAYII